MVLESSNSLKILREKQAHSRTACEYIMSFKAMNIIVSFGVMVAAKWNLSGIQDTSENGMRSGGFSSTMSAF